MSTNYYAVPEVSREKKEELLNLVVRDQWFGLKDKLPEKIHIGKFTPDWEFTFNHNNWAYFPQTKQGIVNFLKNSTIYDEYGDEISFNDFWQIVEKSKGGQNAESYYANWEDKHPRTPFPPDWAREIDLYVEGLRFSQRTLFF